MKKIVAIFILILFFTACNSNRKKINVIFKENPVIELGGFFCANAFIEEIHNGELVDPNACFPIETKDEIKLEIQMKQTNGKTVNFPLIVKVQDTTGPKIEYTAIVEEVAGTRFNLLEDVSAWDLADGAVPVEIVGSWDSRRVGEYLLQYEAKDFKGNTTTVDFKLIIKRGGSSIIKQPIINSDEEDEPETIPTPIPTVPPLPEPTPEPLPSEQPTPNPTNLPTINPEVD